MSTRLQSILIRFGFLFVLVLFFVLLMKGAFAPGSAQSEKAQANEARQLDDLVPKHLPIKIKIKAEKEDAFKDLKNAHWTRDFELEVKNIGTRPIYFLSFVFTLPEIRMPDGNLYGFSLSYGRGQFITDPATVPTEKDIPIKPGETHVFKLPEHRITNWERYQQDAKIKQPKRVEIMFDHLSFGDGTGFNSPGGRGLDDRGRKQGQSETPPSPPPLSERVNADCDSNQQPVIFAPANFLFAETENEIDSPATALLNETLPATAVSNEPIEATPDICCPGTSCTNIKVVFSRCYCSVDDPAIDDMRFDTSTACTDPAGHCGYTYSRTTACSHSCCPFPLFCTESFFVACGDPIPTPTPTPTPSPSPEPTCDPAAQPNPTNCVCQEGPAGYGSWQCWCPQGREPANYILYPNSAGCEPTKSFNNGFDCCQCSNEGVNCGEGKYFDKYFCQCNDVATPTPTPTPTPPQDPEGCDSWNRYWNFQSLGCYLEEQLCPSHCSPYQPLDSGGCYDAVDYCHFNFGCGFGLTDGGSGCCCGATPVLIDVSGNGFNLTDAYTGVFFDMGGDGHKEPIAWPAVGSDDAWLVLDRNVNGTIDNAREMFGNFTDQPHAVTSRNGFVALSEFDRSEYGGNNDNRIDSQDSIFQNLRLWQDINHNGFSEPAELHPLLELAVATIELNYKSSKKTDSVGNRFSYRARVKDIHGTQLGRWAWDVTLLVNPPPKK